MARGDRREEAKDGRRAGALRVQALTAEVDTIPGIQEGVKADVGVRVPVPADMVLAGVMKGPASVAVLSQGTWTSARVS